MRWAPKTLSYVVVLLISLAAIPKQVSAQNAGGPEMVWVNYVQGDVEFSPGNGGHPNLGREWIATNAGQVMQDGYTLVTGAGRAEIEFEDGSLIFLAGHAALEFDTLWSTATGFVTYVDLLTGTATVAHPFGGLLELETSLMTIRMFGSETTRVQAALDGVVIQQIQGTQTIVANNGSLVLQPGQSAVYADHSLIPLTPTETASEQEQMRQWSSGTVRQPQTSFTVLKDAWDEWVEQRLATRRKLIAEGLNESGLKEPIPGLAGLVEAGRFLDCPPYGKCWQPNEPGQLTQSPSPAAVEPPTGQPAVGPRMLTDAESMPEPTAQSAPAQSESGTGGILVNSTMLTRCPMQAWQVAAAAQNGGVQPAPQYAPCFAGSWASLASSQSTAPSTASAQSTSPSRTSRRRTYTYDDPCYYFDPLTGRRILRPECNNYVYKTWVVGQRHRRPCHFVKLAHRQIGIVPRHPGDRSGYPLGNAKSGILVLDLEKGTLHAGLENAPAKGVQAVSSVPASLQHGVDRAVEHASSVAQPQIEARLVESLVPRSMLPKDHPVSAKDVTAIRFDYHSQNFVGHSGAGGGEHGVVVGHYGGGSVGGGHIGGGGDGGHAGGGVGGGGGGHSGGGSGGASGGGGGGGAAGGGHH